ncbi:MAG: hypothetical protein UHN88_06410 [Eubacterium sp.]|nr:hypothetical protein [Eubacterium sp.]
MFHGKSLRNIEKLHYDEEFVFAGDSFDLPDRAGDFEISFLEGKNDPWSVKIGDVCEVTWENGQLALSAVTDGTEKNVQSVEAKTVEFVRILVDSAEVRVDLNDGEYVLETQFNQEYTAEKPYLTVVPDCRFAAVTGWKLHKVNEQE